MQHLVPAHGRALPRSRTPAPAPRPSADAEALAVLHRSARALMAGLPELTERLMTLLREREPAYRTAMEADAESVRDEVRRSLRLNVESLIRPGELREAARRCSWAIGRARADRGLPLDALLRAFRLGGGMVWQELVDETTRRQPSDARLLVHVAADVWNFVDEHCAVVAEAYRQTERELMWRRENRLRLMTAALLDGTARIADLPATAAALGLPEQGRYAVVLARLPAGRTFADAWGQVHLSGLRVLWYRDRDGGGSYGIVLLAGHPHDEVEPGHSHESGLVDTGPGPVAAAGGAPRDESGGEGERPRSYGLDVDAGEIARRLTAPPGAR
ncbi:PucR family transcriptional regulator, partial [Streptomyces sp. NPDC059466]|uniref:PucR family transcriptional regulator n=1 Tax=Streptomyces sp. NPDC059466 TaxID=3346843 RepID=UPI00368D448A